MLYAKPAQGRPLRRSLFLLIPPQGGYDRGIVARAEKIQVVQKMIEVVEKEDLRLKKKRILVVDDDGTMLRTIKSWLSEKYQVFMVNSGMAAITFLAKNEVDLILLDYEMPVTTGPQVLEMLRSEKKTSKIPVIFLTNKRDKESVMNVLDLKPEGYLLKTRGKFALLTQLSEFFEKEKAKDY